MARQWILSVARKGLMIVGFFPACNLWEQVSSPRQRLKNLLHCIAKMNDSLAAGLHASVRNGSRAPVNILGAKSRHVSLRAAQVPEQFVINAQFCIALGH